MAKQIEKKVRKVRSPQERATRTLKRAIRVLETMAAWKVEGAQAAAEGIRPVLAGLSS